MIHIYTGDGKGKTTAAVGLAVRAAGAGMRVYFFQFLKNGSSSEIKVLSQIEDITVKCCEVCNKFTFRMNDEEKAEVRTYHNNMLREIKNLIDTGSADMIVMDEIFGALSSGLLDVEEAEKIIRNPENTELVLTGRNPPPSFAESADYYSEIRAVKHPYENGITARKGIEY